MTLYSAFLSMAPFILLAVTAGAFGPWSKDKDEEWSYSFLWDVVLVLSVITGGILSILVLGEVVAPSELTQDFVVVAGCVSLALLAEHMLSAIRARYRAHRSDLTADDGVSDDLSPRRIPLIRSRGSRSRSATSRVARGPEIRTAQKADPCPDRTDPSPVSEHGSECESDDEHQQAHS